MSCAQGLSNVLDCSYIPVTQEEAALFTMEVGYLWAVFTKVLKEPRAAKLVRDHGNTADAQLLLQQLVTKMTTGMTAKTGRQELEATLFSF